MTKYGAAAWLFPSGKVSIPIPGMATDRSDRVADGIADDRRRRLKLARASLDWTNDTIAIVFGFHGRTVVNWISRDVAPPLRVVAALEALVKDPVAAHHLNCLVAERVGPRARTGARATGRPPKRKLTPGKELKPVIGLRREEKENPEGWEVPQGGSGGGGS